MNKAYFRDLRNATEKLSKWSRNQKVFGYFDNLDKSRKKNKNDRIYEFYCFMRIAKDLKHNYYLRLENTGVAGLAFPMTPGYKNEFCYYSLLDTSSGVEKYQLCYGIKIELSFASRTKHAVDISIQKAGASITPDENDVKIIMDAKFSKKANTKMSKQNISYFGQWVKDLDVETASRSGVQFDSLTDLKANCLITNAECQDVHEDYCKHLKVKQIGKFDCGSRTYDVVG